MEPYVFGLASLTALGFSFGWKQRTIYSLIYGSFVFVLREVLIPLFPGLNGFRVVFSIILNVFILKGVFKLKMVEAVLADVLFFTLLITAESFGLVLLRLICPESVAEILSGRSFFWRGMIGIFSFAVIGLLIYCLKFRKQVFLPIQYITERNEDDKI